jgi:hypothetical protein
LIEYLEANKKKNRHRTERDIRIRSSDGKESNKNEL